MKIYPYSSLPNFPSQFQARQLAWTSLVVGLVLLGLSVGFICLVVVENISKWLLLLLILIAPIGWLFFKVGKRGLASHNWYLRYGEDIFLLKIRSHQNHLPNESDPIVIEFSKREVKDLKVIRTETDQRSQLDRGNRQIVSHIFLDFQFYEKIPIEIIERIQNEPKIRKSSGIVREYPVTLHDEYTIRLTWRSQYIYLMPNIKKFIALMTGKLIIHEQDREALSMEEQLKIAIKENNAVTGIKLIQHMQKTDVVTAKKIFQAAVNRTHSL